MAERLPPYLGKNGFSVKLVNNKFLTACLTAAAFVFLKTSARKLLPSLSNPMNFALKDKTISAFCLVLETMMLFEFKFPSSFENTLVGIVVPLCSIYT